jgi:hypothetical protein
MNLDHNIYSKTNIIKSSYLIFIIFIYISGFLWRENIAGAAETDFLKFTWPAVLSFKRDFIYSILNYGKFGEGSTPLFHILNAFINPFTYSQISFQGSIAFVSFLNVIIFSNIIEDKFKIKKIDATVCASIFLLLPFYRSSAFWGLTENLGWLFLLISIKYFLRLDRVLKKNFKLNIFLTCLFSSLALYTRPYLVFFPIFVLCYFIVNKNYKSLIYATIIYSLFSVPGLALLYTWGGSVFLGTGDNKINFIQDYHNPKYILKNLIIFPSIFLFYFAPFKLIEALNREKLFTSKKIYLYIYLFILISIFSLYYFDFFEYLKNMKLGGGSILKINQFIFKENLIIFLLISFIGIITIIDLALLSKKNLILLCSVILIYCTPKFIYQEYFEPLFIILFFLLFDLKANSNKIFKDNKFSIILIIYFFGYYVTSYYYRYYLETI